MILTEHGIYNKERRIEIAAATWIDDWDSTEIVAEHDAPFFRRHWTQHFSRMSRVCYDLADEIFTLYSGNKGEQIHDGARADKIHIIPNGIDMDRFAAAAEIHRQERERPRPYTVGFIGRVSPIKDVETFLAAMRLVADQVPHLRVRILGPMAEDESYATRCRNYADQLGLAGIVAFEGAVAVEQEMPTLDVIVLTSISEAQPLVILEAGAVGIPTVTTDVGCCRDLLFGRTPADRMLGSGGIVTPIASPGATAAAIVRLHQDPALRHQMGDAMRRRVYEHYDHGSMIEAYRTVYGRWLQTTTGTVR
jgi:glycosyltransferase involved in cell wall biosynthesis